MGARRKKSRKRSDANLRSTQQPDEQYEFFVDECVAPKQVAAMLREAGHIAHVQGSETFGTGTHDVDWLPDVGARHWVLITKDKHIRKRQIELRLLNRSGVRAFVFTGANLRGEEQALALKEALPAMLRLLRRRAANLIARVTADSSVELIEIHKYIKETDE